MDDLQTHLTTGYAMHRRIHAEYRRLYPTEAWRQGRLRRLQDWSTTVQQWVDAVERTLQHLDDPLALRRFRQAPLSPFHLRHEDQQWSTLNNRVLGRLEALRAIRTERLERRA
jgi:hypothetical protein